MDLKSIFLELPSMQARRERAVSVWRRLESSYSEPSRHYHTLTHLRGLFGVLESFQSFVEDWEIMSFAVFFHDVIYDVARNDNEEQSANEARSVMADFGITPERIERCVRHILATRGHAVSDDPDTNLFTDADLSILGSVPALYKEYARAIRREYSVYSDADYNNRRMQVLRSFLSKPLIFKTTHFRRYEEQARLNLEWEITCLLV